MSRSAVVAAVFSVVPLSGCLDPYRRAPMAREIKTIFSPVGWPAPSPSRLVSGLPGPAYWQQQVDYQIEATLDEENETLRATGRMTYTNHSPDALPYLW